MINYSVDQSGTVVDPALHDSELFLIETEKSSIKLGFKLVDEEIILCSLIGVKQFICNGLRQGNTVLDLTLVEGEALSNRVRGKLFPLPKVQNEYFNKFLKSIDCDLKNKDLTLVIVNPTYGCEILALCEKLTFERFVK